MWYCGYMQDWIKWVWLTRSRIDSNDQPYLTSPSALCPNYVLFINNKYLFLGTQPILSDSTVTNGTLNTFDNFKTPITGVYRSWSSSLNGFYRSSPDELAPYFSNQNELNYQPKMFPKQLRACHSFDSLSESSTSSQEFDFQGNGWLKLAYSSSYNSYVNQKSLFRPIKSKLTTPFLSDSSVFWADQENPSDSVELIVSNLDYNISSREWKEILYSTFRSAVMVSSLKLLITIFFFFSLSVI